MKTKGGMPKKVWLWFGLLIALDVLVWALQKAAIVQAEQNSATLARALLHQPFAWLALLIAPLQLLLWTRVLARTELSLAYPATSISYPLTMLVAVLFYHEKATLDIWIGALLVTVGVWLLLSKEEEKDKPE
jgi:uncharacterized membrane protein